MELEQHSCSTEEESEPQESCPLCSPGASTELYTIGEHSLKTTGLVQSYRFTNEEATEIMKNGPADSQQCCSQLNMINKYTQCLDTITLLLFGKTETKPFCNLNNDKTFPLPTRDTAIFPSSNYS